MPDGMEWRTIKKIWNKNGHPSSRDLQKLLAAQDIEVDDGNIRKYIRKWSKEIAARKEDLNWTGRGDELWEEMIEKSEDYIEYHQLEPLKFFEADSQKPIGISFVSDQHFGNMGVDYKRAKKDAKLIGNTEGLYAIDGGDAADNFINTKIKAAMVNQKVPPVEQMEMLRTYYSWFNNKIIAKISGNHEFWTKQHCGLDFYDVLKPDVIVPPVYSKHQAKVQVFCNDIEYRILVRHKYRYNSSFNQTHTVKRMWEQSDWAFDIGVVGHHHNPAIEPFNRHGTKHWAVRPGSYKIEDEYNKEKGFYGVEAACPTVILYPNKKKMTMFEDIYEAIEHLKLKRGKYEKI